MEKKDYDVVRKLLQQRVVAGIDMTNTISDEQIMAVIDELISQEALKYTIPLRMRMQLRKDIYDSLRKLDVIQQLVDDDEVTEIMVNGFDNIFYEKRGKITRWDKKFESDDKYNDVIQQIVSRVNRAVNESSPIADARLEDGSRVNVVLPPVAIDGAVLTIRKFPKNNITMEDMIENHSISKEGARFLNDIVKARYNIFISGGTSSGKTTLLNALAGYIQTDERIITIEDSAELQINNIPNLVRMEVKNANTEGSKEITIRDLIKSSLRMRPDRIIIGEVRDEAALDLLSACNTGHDGSISTGHSNCAADMLIRLESMCLMGSNMPVVAIRRQIASAIDIIIHLARMPDKTRKVLEISELVGMKGDSIILNPLFEYKDEDENHNGKKGLVRTENRLVHCEKILRAYGIKGEW